MPNQHGNNEFVANLAINLVHIRDAFIEAISEFKARIEDVGFELNKQNLQLVGKYLYDPEMIEAFTELQLVPAPSMSHSFVQTITSDFHSGSAPEDLIKSVVDYYEDDSCHRVECIVENLKTNPELSVWHNTLDDFLIAHKLGLDSITTYPLVAMVEGVVLDVVSEYSDDRALLRYSMIPNHLQSATLFEALGELNEQGATLNSFYCAVHMIDKVLFEGKKHWTDAPRERRDFEKLNRHRLFHGMVQNGTRLHTLRCLQILEVIALVLPAVREGLGDSTSKNMHSEPSTDSQSTR